jgi:hypothetical protein
MSFLSRRPSRSGSRDGDAGRDDEYGDYDYAPDGYGGEEDESWSPGEYFSPEGIKGRWAGGQRSADRGDARGRRGDARRGEAGRGDSGRTDQGPGYEDQTDDGYAPGNGYGYGADEYATGAYDLPEGSDEEPAERGGRRRKDAGERTGIFRLRRDRGEDIWPDDGISDEDYWASVASDRPLTGPGSAHEADPLAADAPPMGRAGNDTGPRPAAGGDGVRAAAAGPRLDADSRTGADQRFGDEQRGVTGRLGPPPGLRGDFQPGSAPSAARPGTGPQARPGTGPQARPGTGPMPARPGATSAGAAGAWSSQAGFAQSGSQQPYRPSGPQGAYQPSGPAGRQLDSRETDGRQPDRGAEWGERTERIDRVNASGYPEPRANSRSQPPGRAGTPRASDPFGAPATSGPSRNSGPFGVPVTPASFSAPVAAGRGSDGARGESSWAEGGRGTDRRAPERRSPARDTDRASLRNSGGWPAPGRDTDRANVRNSGGWPAAGRGGAPADRVGDDDPLTSRAYSRAAVSDADGRSYAVAARRSQAQAKLTEEPTATFTAAASYPSDRYRARQYETGATEVYPAARQYQAGATGEYPAQYPAGTNAASAASRSGRYQAGEYGQYQDRPQPPSARYQGYGSQPGQAGQLGSHGSPGQSSASARRGSSAAADPSGNGSASRSAASAAAGGPAGLGRPAGPSAPHSADGYGRSNGSGGPNGAGTSGRPSGPSQAGQPVGGSGRVSLPSGSGTHSGPYPTQSAVSGQQSRQPQQRPHSQPSRHAAPSQIPAAGSAVGGGSTAAAAAARTTPAATGQNPYDSSVTGSYPYPSQPYPSRSAAPSTAGPVPGAANPTVDGRDARDRRDARDGRAYRPVPSADGYGSANADYGTQGYGSARDGRR